MTLRVLPPLVLCLSAALWACAPAPSTSSTPAPPSPPAPPAVVAAASPSGALSPAPAPVASAAPSAALSPTSTGASSASLTRIVVGYSETYGGMAALWVTNEAGLFSQNGLDVDLQLITSANNVSSLISGQTQIAVGGGAEVLTATAGGADLLDVGEFSPVYPYILEVAPDIRAVDDLKGQKLGVSQFGSASDVATRVALRQINLDPDTDVSIVPVGSLQNRTAAMLSGAIQGGVAQPPDQLAVEAQGFHPLVDLAALKLPIAGNTIAVQRSYANSNRATVQKFVDAVVQGIKRAKTDRAFTIEVLKKYLQSTDDVAMAATYDEFVGKVLAPVPAPTTEQFQDIVAQLASTNPKVTDVDLTTLVDTSFVESAASRGLAAQ